VFFAVTAFGLYVLQNGVITILTQVWTWPVELATSIIHLLRLDSIFSDEFVRANCAKVAAIATSMVWNYTMYKKVVFKA
jgi:putative flippase GtrA